MTSSTFSEFIAGKQISVCLLSLDHNHRKWRFFLKTAAVIVFRAGKSTTINNPINSLSSRPKHLSFSLSSQRCSQCVGVIGGPSCTSSCCWSFKPEQPLDRSTLVHTFIFLYLLEDFFNPLKIVVWIIYLCVCVCSAHCRYALGMEDGRIQDEAITASSQWYETTGPQYARSVCLKDRTC